MINFVSNLPADQRSGGFSAMNAAARDAVSKVAPLTYAGPINPPPRLRERVLSKAARLAGRKGAYFFYSARRLGEIAARVSAASDAQARMDFFHGFTPWVLSRADRPYVAWSDCTFRDYIDIYHRRDDFNAADLARIEQAEAAWLKRAERVLFTSEWARGRAISDYGLDEDRTSCVGIFGEIEAPRQDAYAGELTFVFVSTNFSAKGGDVVLAAFRAVQAERPDARLIIVGDAPRHGIEGQGVEIAGFLRKEAPAEAARFTEILSRARAVVHPTKSDIAPLMLVEAAYFGCPAIATRRFAIPEIVEDRRTGILLDDPESVAAVAQAMIDLAADGESYDGMRRAAWSRARRRHTKLLFEQRMATVLAPLLEAGRRSP